MTRSDRQEIAYYLNTKQYSRRTIAALIGKSKSAVSYEIRRNSVKGSYKWEKAHHKARVRRQHASWQGRKLCADPALRAWVEDKLVRDWSPEEIAGRLKHQEPHRGYVSFSALYRYLDTARGEPFKKYLRYQGQSYGSEKRASALSQRPMIDQRPASAQSRQILGHWEADFIVSGKGGPGALLVLVERALRYVLLFKLPNRQRETINAALADFINAQIVCKSITIDNDVCFAHHQQMSDIVGADIYFCYPYHSWEKGSVENMNKWIRQYIKKGSDIASYSDEYVAFVQERLNTRPRKCLQYMTPQEVLEKSEGMKKEISAIIQKGRVCCTKNTRLKCPSWGVNVPRNVLT